MKPDSIPKKFPWPDSEVFAIGNSGQVYLDTSIELTSIESEHEESVKPKLLRFSSDWPMETDILTDYNLTRVALLNSWQIVARLTATALCNQHCTAMRRLFRYSGCSAYIEKMVLAETELYPANANTLHNWYKEVSEHIVTISNDVRIKILSSACMATQNFESSSHQLSAEFTSDAVDVHCLPNILIHNAEAAFMQCMNEAK